MARPPLLSNRTQYSTRILMSTTLLSMVLSLPIIIVGFWLAFRHHIDCFKFLEGPIIFIGLALFFISIVGMVGANRHKAFLMWTYMLSLFFLILLLFAFTLFAFFVISGGGGHRVRGATFQEYRLGDFSLWFQDQTTDPYKWPTMKSCLQDSQLCAGLNKTYPTPDDFYTAELSPIQSGCCKPPTACNFTFVTPIEWVNTTRATTTSDCGRWDNDPSKLCYDCSSCRAGLLQNVKQDWNVVAKVCLASLILLALVYFVAWLAFLKGLWDNIFSATHGTPHHGYARPHI